MNYELAGVQPQPTLKEEAPARVTEVLRELRAVIAAGAFDTPELVRGEPGLEWSISRLRSLHDSSTIPVLPWVAGDTGTADRVRTRVRLEGAIATKLLGQLPAFPNASIDVILDVRERLVGPRTHFRAAIAQTARDLTAAEESGEDIEGMVRELRTTTIDPALQEIEDTLRTLKARPTLLRVGSDPITGIVATLAIAAGAGGGLATLEALVGGAVGAPLAAAVKELGHHRNTKADLRARPYWMLREANDRLSRG